jgi:hypothetical protein
VISDEVLGTRARTPGAVIEPVALLGRWSTSVKAAGGYPASGPLDLAGTKAS